MRDVHDIYTTFKAEFPELSARISETSHAIHTQGGPLDEKTRALIKITAAGAAGHHTALETHLVAAREAGVTDGEILHTLLMLVSTCGFPTFMEAYSVFKRMKP
jgi:alkylhydroperoxidase/carboxymuconolactone decarboxylase family protein YurZ